MQRTVTIDGREVQFRASAAVPRLYRIKFRRDIITDMAAIHKQLQAQQAAKEGEEGPELSTLPVGTLELFEDVAYIMAKHADPEGVPNNVDAWLDGFDTFSIYRVFPVIEEMWANNMAQTNTPQKK